MPLGAQVSTELSWRDSVARGAFPPSGAPQKVLGPLRPGVGHSGLCLAKRTCLGLNPGSSAPGCVTWGRGLHPKLGLLAGERIQSNKPSKVRYVLLDSNSHCCPLLPTAARCGCWLSRVPASCSVFLMGGEELAMG